MCKNVEVQVKWVSPYIIFLKRLYSYKIGQGRVGQGYPVGNMGNTPPSITYSSCMDQYPVNITSGYFHMCLRPVHPPLPPHTHTLPDLDPRGSRRFLLLIELPLKSCTQRVPYQISENELKINNLFKTTPTPTRI